jgi:hypothetical protein
MAYSNIFKNKLKKSLKQNIILIEKLKDENRTILQMLKQ